MMKLSESIEKNIMESKAGSIINRFIISKRRSVLFFEEILANYIKLCESRGYSDDLRDIGNIWGRLSTNGLVNLNEDDEPTEFMNSTLQQVWKNIGLMDSLNISKESGRIKLSTSNEYITREIGSNEFMIGVYQGILESIFGECLDVQGSTQTEQNCSYSFTLTGKEFIIETKEKTTYDQLNNTKLIDSHNLKDAFNLQLLNIKDNQIYFKDKRVNLTENTIFHIISNRGILLDEVQKISYNFFRDLVEEVSGERKIKMIKFLLQALGWGTIRITLEDNDVIVNFTDLPHGFQTENENWEFLIQTVLGYLKLVNESISIREQKSLGKSHTVIYRINQ